MIDESSKNDLLNASDPCMPDCICRSKRVYWRTLNRWSMRKHLALVALLCILAFSSFSQNHFDDRRPFYDFNKVDKGDMGIGLGLDYGGLGMNLLLYPQKNIGIFGGVGYALAGAGYNAGLKLRLNPEGKRAVPYFLLMYGYNAAIVIANDYNSGYGAQNLNKLFYGPSVGVGVDVKSRKVTGAWSFALLIPFRSSDVDNYMNELTADYGVSFETKPLPFTISVGYHWVLF